MMRARPLGAYTGKQKRQAEHIEEGYGVILRGLRDAGVDTHHVRPVKRVFLLRANAEEPRAITGIDVIDRRTGRRAASTLLRRGVQAACIQAGHVGDLLVWRSENEREQDVVEGQVCRNRVEVFRNGRDGVTRVPRSSPVAASRRASARPLSRSGTTES